MRRPDETPRQPGQEAPRRAVARPGPGVRPVGAAAVVPPASVSKTRRKQTMLALQDLGEALVGLSPARLAALPLPERLADAVAAASRLTRREARRRQLQYIGRLMRDVDPAPIEARLAQWAVAPHAEKARIAAVERWRERLLAGADALDQLCAESPRADRPRLAALAARATAERIRGAPPHAYRELFRELNALLAADEEGLGARR
jgi:ribosome-associated protein